ncbi:hypothetical protein CLOP_g12093, partial [Closterium sp. NIES-67]
LGHFGVDKTLKALQLFYYWPDMVTDVQRYLAASPICQRMKSSHQRPTRLLQPLEPPQRPWQYVTMDFVTGLPAASSGNDAVLVVVDRLTEMVHFAPCRTTITSEETARLFISAIVNLHGIPAAIISNRDPKFTSKFWQDTWARYGTRLQFSSAYHPQTDGQTERTNQTMEQLIRTNCSDRNKWEDALPMLEFSYNNAPSALTDHSPFYLNYGMDPTVPISTNVESQLGSGAFGDVYKGVSPRDGTTVWAILQMADKNHPNLVRLLGFAVGGDLRVKIEQILIYEFVPNGDLHKWIDPEASNPLNFKQRLDILIGIARGFEYLHSFDIVHRDIKPANILITSDMQAKIADFGLVRAGEGTTVGTTRIMGTPGYVDPVYSRTSKATPASDVYSFGVLMLVVLTRQAPLTESATGETRQITPWVSPEDEG